MYGSISTSVQSRFPGIGKTIMLSWPRYHGSFIERMAEKNRNDPTAYVAGPYATWETNPRYTKADFADHFRKNPELARAKYMARPGQAVDRYFSNPLAVLLAFHSRQTEAFDIVRDEADPGREPPVDYADMRIAHMLPPDHSARYCWHVDLALNHDRAAVAMAHHSGYTLGATGEQVPVVTLDLVYWWEAREGQEIDFTEIRRMIMSMAHVGYRTCSVTYDGWQSNDSLQILRRHDQLGNQMIYGRDGKPLRPPIDAGPFSLDSNTRGYDTLKELVYEPGRLEAFHCPLLVSELLNLVLVNGKKVDHPASGSKDLADSVAGAVFGALQNLSSRPARETAAMAPSAAIIGAQRAAETPRVVDAKSFIPKMMVR
jgi:hypothetical protein